MDVEVKAMALNVVIPEELRWTDVRRGEEFELQTVTVRLLPRRRPGTAVARRKTAGPLLVKR